MQTIDPRIVRSRRAAIVSRPDGYTSMVKASAISTPEELAYAIRFLTDHYTYKRSKETGSVNVSAGREALAAIAASAESFARDVLKQGQPDVDAVSDLENGIVRNPYSNVR